MRYVLQEALPLFMYSDGASVVEAFTDRANAGGDYKVGLSTDVYGEAWTLAAGVFGENVAITGAGGADEGFGLHARTPIELRGHAGSTWNEYADALASSWRKTRS